MKVEGSLEIAAAKAGMDAKTARKYRRLGRPSCRKLMGATEQGRGGTKEQPRIEDETVFTQIGFAPFDTREPVERFGRY